MKKLRDLDDLNAEELIAALIDTAGGQLEVTQNSLDKDYFGMKIDIFKVHELYVFRLVENNGNV